MIGALFSELHSPDALIFCGILEKSCRKLTAGVPGIWPARLRWRQRSAGTHRGMQRRVCMAEVSGGFLLGADRADAGAVSGQAKMDYFQEMLQSSGFTGKGFSKNFYGALCAFSGLGLMPFVLGMWRN